MGTSWNDVKLSLQRKVSEAAWQLWIEPIQAVEAPPGNVDNDKSNGHLVLGCPNPFFISWVKEHFLGLIKEEARALGLEPGFEFVVTAAAKNVSALPRGAETLGQLALPGLTSPRGRRLLREFTFDEFVVGSSNSFAYQAALALASSRDGIAPAIYLCSGTGLGKSHLAQAVGNHVALSRPEVKVVYSTAEEFTNELVSAIRAGRMEAFKEKYRRSCDLLLLEEVQFLSGKEKTQGELACTLDALTEGGKRVVFTGSALPRDIPNLRGRLRSRLSQGLITSIEEPDFETRAKIIRRKAARKGLTLEDEVADYLAANLMGDVRQMESAITALAARHELLKAPIDMKLAREVVSGMVAPRSEVTIERIQSVVGQYYQVSLEDMVSRSRRRQIVVPRNLAMYFCRRHTPSSLERIGRAFNRDHATVIYAVNSVEEQLRKKPPLRNQVKFLSERLLGEGKEED